MNRYLMFFSYIGSGFRGLQRQVPRNVSALNYVPTVAEVIEDALKRRLNLPELPILHTASRTDAGVHALRTSAHIDLPKSSWRPIDIVLTLNYYFNKICCPIRILSLQRVSDEFNSRSSPIERSYLYRFGVLDDRCGHGHGEKHSPFTVPTPITEYLRCHFITQEFNEEAVKEVLPLFCGTHDFRTFMASIKNTEKQYRQLHNKEITTTRTLASFTLTKGKPLIELSAGPFHYWQLTCSGKAFLYKQVRRMVSALLAVANGSLTADDIRYMLDNPSHKSWKSSISTVPAHGLYLSDVVYRERDLVAPVDVEVEHQPQTPPVHLKTSPKDVVGLSINEKINLRLKKLQLENEANALRS